MTIKSSLVVYFRYWTHAVLFWDSYVVPCSVVHHLTQSQLPVEWILVLQHVLNYPRQKLSALSGRVVTDTLSEITDEYVVWPDVWDRACTIYILHAASDRCRMCTELHFLCDHEPMFEDRFFEDLLVPYAS